MAKPNLNERPYDGYSRRFLLMRNEDETGVSGTGIVAWGVEFPDGHCVTRWNSLAAQTCTWVALEDIESVHGHNGKTKILWLD